ncbi:MAG: YeeE/YedE family protein, partial [Alphaproteobacteria bacterium]|nr:YeeE/YedE family protein [Alphaproteobacteria bacterium]
MAEFDPIFSLAGGLLIGLASILLMASIGRIAGISGITLGILTNAPGDKLWRFTFLGGLIVAPVLYGFATGSPVPFSISGSIPALVIGGGLVGFGAVLGGGCTSGHGVCGIGRLSRQSFVSVGVFMATAFAVYTLGYHV